MHGGCIVITDAVCEHYRSPRIYGREIIMDIATAHRLLGIVTDDAPYADDNLRDGFECVGAAEDRLSSYEALVESYDMPEHVEPEDVTREMLDGWSTMVDELMRLIRESGTDLADARTHLERVVHYFDDREERAAS